ncbi:ABC transporter substrate-binding protein [Reyranella sp.]|uniref:ABC transporter substrate-binding protein n=1 Tax=Reyranella sp. TaxID=1929291 RepID=UPI003BAC26AD
MAGTKRRSLLRLAGGGAAASMATILATGRMPAFARQRTVHWLKWVDFVPASDALLRGELLPEAERALGVRIVLETVNGNDLKPRVTAAISSGAGPDLVMAFNEQTYLYAGSAVDLTDIAQSVAQAEGGLCAYARTMCSNGGRFMAMPWAVIGNMIAYRRSWFEEAGAASFPGTWAEYRDVARKLKARGRPIGQTLGHTLGDSPSFTYPYLWSWGGMEVDPTGKVVLNSAATLDSVKFMQDFWKDACDERGLTWDDTGNNRAFLSQSISATLNGASIYLETLRRPERYRTANGTPMNRDILHAPLPAGPAGRFGLHLLQSNMLMKYSTNQEAVKDFLKWIHAEKNFEQWFVSQKGFSTPCTETWEGHAAWTDDPVMAPFKVAAKLGQAPGRAGPPDARAAEALSTYVISDMYAKAVQGMPAEEAVKWADGRLRKIYG